MLTVGVFGTVGLVTDLTQNVDNLIVLIVVEGKLDEFGMGSGDSYRVIRGSIRWKTARRRRLGDEVIQRALHFIFFANLQFRVSVMYATAATRLAYPYCSWR
jgi:hypothetical protein